MKTPTPRCTRGTGQVDERLNSPVTDPGYWPYDRLSGGLQETVVGIDEPQDPLGLVPSYKGTRDGEEEINGKER